MVMVQINRCRSVAIDDEAHDMIDYGAGNRRSKSVG